MYSGFRSLFAWVIALALSLSGYASATMSLCGGMLVPVVQSPAQMATAMGMSRDRSSTPIDSAHRSATDCTTMAIGVHCAESPARDCTASAACGMVAAPAPQAPAFAVLVAGAAHVLPPSAPGFGFFIDAPLRPPRAFA